MLGANPFDSQGSLLAAPYLMKRLRALRERGGRFIVVDPRRTGTAERADDWIPIQPGTDAALLLAMLQVLFTDDLINLGCLRDQVHGVDALRELCVDFTPEAVEGTCRIPAARIRKLAHELAKSERAVVYGRIGTCTQEFGTLASWLIDVLNLLTGNFDKAGGAMFSNPIAWSMLSLRPPEFEDGFELGRFHSRVRGAPEILGQFPVSCLAEEIAESGEGQIKALITIAGNPVLSAPGGDRLDEALPNLDYIVRDLPRLKERVARAPEPLVSVAGEIEVPVEVTDEMMPGVVCLPHGFGHDKEGAQLSVASQYAGACSNVLAPGPLVDVPSGNAVVNGIPVQVAPG
jgi:anaerobic selenocysteine-containing dehydrogenase